MKNVDVSGKGLNVLEKCTDDIIESFDCSGIELTSLQGIPINKHVNGYFNCYDNKLTSLQGAPKYVDGDCYCSNNQLTSLQGAPEEIGGDFNCSGNKLLSLEGAPKFVGGNFVCSDQKNGKKFTIEEVESTLKEMKCHVAGEIIV